MQEIDYKAAYGRLEQEMQWVHDLMRNDTIEPREKVVLYQTKYELEFSKKDEDGLAHVRIWKISEETGISTDRIGKSLMYLADKGVIRREAGSITNSRGIKEKATYVAFTELAYNPKDISLSDNGHGGTRKPKPKIFCPDCGGTHIVDITRRQCTACGSIISEKHKFLNDEIEQEGTGKNEEVALHTYHWFLEESGSIDYAEPFNEFIIEYPQDWDDTRKQKFSDYVYMHHTYFLRFLEEQTKEDNE